jgi:non-canonical purine NTP pyrophosphatase (RdgB/HAM1 family)
MKQKSRLCVLIATGNSGKFTEIAAELSGLGMEYRSLKDFPVVPECEETGKSFEENAVQKARYYAECFKILTLADDSGLEVDALAGAPGVYSARYAGIPCNDQANNAKLVKELTGIPAEKRSARFRCVMALVDPNGKLLGTTQGTIEGIIVDEPRGKNGFGYDPHFFVPSLKKTTAEISREHKNKISHRGQATRAMHELLIKIFRSR